INTGINLRNPTYNKYTAPIVTFQKHFEELWKKYNLYLIVEDILTDSPKLRLEPESYLYQDDLGISISNNDTIKRSIDYDKLFNSVTVGSDNFMQDFGISQPMYYTQLLTFVEETYNIDGVIGVDNELNLVSEYVIDWNKISEYI